VSVGFEMKQRMILTVRDGFRFGFGLLLAQVFFFYIPIAIIIIIGGLIILF